MFEKFNFSVLMVLFITIEAKPLSLLIEDTNNINHDQPEIHQIQSTQIKKEFDQSIESSKLRTKIGRNLSTDRTDRNNEESTTADFDDDIEDEITTIPPNTTTAGSNISNNSSNILSILLELFSHKLKFSPQTLFQDRLETIKDILENFGITLPNNVSKPKQLLNTSGLIHLAGLDDNGFYTNRLQPAGFLGGNGWFANKGGLLGGPGAILSTGSLLTDYPTSYRKKK